MIVTRYAHVMAITKRIASDVVCLSDIIYLLVGPLCDSLNAYCKTQIQLEAYLVFGPAKLTELSSYYPNQAQCKCANYVLE